MIMLLKEDKSGRMYWGCHSQHGQSCLRQYSAVLESIVTILHSKLATIAQVHFKQGDVTNVDDRAAKRDHVARDAKPPKRIGSLLGANEGNDLMSVRGSRELTRDLALNARNALS